MTKVKVSHLKDLARLRASKEAKLVPVLLVEALVPLARGEVVDLLVVPDSRGMEMLVEEMYLCAIGAITCTLESVGEEAADTLHVGRGVQGRSNQVNGGRGGRQQAQGRVNNITPQDAYSNPDLIMSTLNILGHFARVLNGCGTTNSVSSHTFAQVTQSHPTPLGFELEFAMPREEKCYVDYVYPGCPVMVEDVVMPTNLISLDIVDFEVILR